MNQFVWQRCLNVAEADATGYHDNTRGDLIEGLDFEPKIALDIGCGAGGTGAYLKKKHPDAKVWGIELNKAAAEIATTRIDRVISAKFEDVNLEAEGIAPGTLDLVLCADVLEHLYDPWQVLVGLKRYLSAEGRIVISIPNIRYLPLLDDLARGYWRYADFGILDITHLRFFTLQELRRFIFETGYVIDKLNYGIDPTLSAQLQEYKKKLPCTIDTGKLVLRDVGEEELMELFSGQFFVTIKQGTPFLQGYERPKMGCYFWKGQQSDYHKLLHEHRLTGYEAIAFDRHLADIASPPHFDAIVATTPATLNQLALTVQSLAKQAYPYFSIRIIGEGAPPPALQGNAKIEWISSSGQLWPAIRNAFADSKADWTILLEAGDQLVEHALLYAAEHTLRNPQTVALYVDEDQFDAALQPDTPYFKPDFSLDYYLAHPYLADGILFKTAAVSAAGGIRTAYGSPFQDLTLRLIAASGEESVGHLPDILFRRHPSRSLARQLEANDDGRAALAEFFRTKGTPASIQPGLFPGSHRISYSLQGQPTLLWVSDAPADLQQTRQLVEEGFLKRNYENVELALFASTDLPEEVLAYLEAVDQANIAGLRIFVANPEQTRMARIHAVINESTADYVLLLRADAQPAEASWLKDLLGDACRPKIGAVAPRLMTPQGRLIGNAMLLGCNGIACGFGHGDSHGALGHFGRQLTPQNPSALAVDALVFSRTHYLAAGGFDSTLHETAAAMDFCLRLRQQGLRLLWTPHVSLICTGDTLTRLEPDDESVLLERWLPTIARDPAYNINLSRQTPFALTEQPQVSKLRLPWKPLPRIMAFPGDNMGCGHYRVIEPFNAAQDAGLIDGYLGFDHYNQYDLSVFEADTLLLQRQVTDGQLEFLRNYRKFFKLKLVYELDDLITKLPVESFHKAQMPKDIAKRLRAGLQLCDRFIVSTQPLAEAYRHYNDDIRVVPNRIDLKKWGHLAPQRRTAAKPRVGWAGGVSHSGDLALVTDIIKTLASEVDWVFFGMCPDSIRPYVKEFHVGVPTPDYPAKLASLDLDLAIAPIAHNEFNECKSNLKLLEYGMLGYPVIASDFGPYRCDFPVTLVKNRDKDWIKAIRDHINDLDEAGRRGDLLREHVRSRWILQDHVAEWRSAWIDF